MKIVNGILQDVNIPGVKFVVDIIPQGRKRRPGIKMSPQFITIHNTGCDKVPADNFRRVQLDKTQDVEVSWHFTVDEHTIIQHLPITEVAWHAGNRNGNYTSYGIETCERDGAEEVVIKFVAELLKCHGWATSRVRSHKSWSGKQCPWKILPHWDTFIKNISNAIETKDEDLEVAVNKIIESGVKINTTSWNSMDKMKMQYVPGLISKLGGIEKINESITEHGMSFELEKWKYQFNTGSFNTINVRSLLIRYAATL